MREEDDVPEHTVTGHTGLALVHISNLCNMAAFRKRNRQAFFNSKEGRALTIDVKNHQHSSMETAYYCALCGLHKGTLGGRRTCIKFVQCSVNMFYKVVGGF